jgi:hypothetical protein
LFFCRGKGKKKKKRKKTFCSSSLLSVYTMSRAPQRRLYAPAVEERKRREALETPEQRRERLLNSALSAFPRPRKVQLKDRDAAVVFPELPKDVVGLILERLDDVSFLRARAVCVYFFRVTEASEKMKVIVRQAEDLRIEKHSALPRPCRGRPYQANPHIESNYLRWREEEKCNVFVAPSTLCENLEISIALFALFSQLLLAQSAPLDLVQDCLQTAQLLIGCGSGLVFERQNRNQEIEINGEKSFEVFQSLKQLSLQRVGLWKEEEVEVNVQRFLADCENLLQL